MLLRDRIVEVGMGVINEICRNCTLGNLLLPISTSGKWMLPFSLCVAVLAAKASFLIAANTWVKSQVVVRVVVWL